MMISKNYDESELKEKDKLILQQYYKEISSNYEKDEKKIDVETE